MFHGSDSSHCCEWQRRRWGVFFNWCVWVLGDAVGWGREGCTARLGTRRARSRASARTLLTRAGARGRPPGSCAAWQLQLLMASRATSAVAAAAAAHRGVDVICLRVVPQRERADLLTTPWLCPCWAANAAEASCRGAPRRLPGTMAGSGMPAPCGRAGRPPPVTPRSRGATAPAGASNRQGHELQCIETAAAAAACGWWSRAVSASAAGDLQWVDVGLCCCRRKPLVNVPNVRGNTSLGLPQAAEGHCRH